MTMTRKEKIINSLKFLFIPDLKYWKTTFYALVAFIVLTLIVGFSFNLRNDNLEKRKGVIEYSAKRTDRFRDQVWITYNYKLREDSLIYGQEMYFGNYRPINLFLFGHLEFPHETILRSKEGDSIEFYVNKTPKTFPYLLLKQEDSPRYKKVKNSDNNIITSYGLRLNGKTLFSYTKRFFVEEKCKWVYIIFFLFFIVLIAGFGYNFVRKMWSVPMYLKNLELKKDILSKLPLIEETFYPIVLDESLTLPQKITNLRIYASIASNKNGLIVDLARHYWYDLHQYKKAEELYLALNEAYPNDISVWEGYYEMLKKQKRKKDLYEFEENLYNLDPDNGKVFARWYKARGQMIRYKYWKKRLF